jgi:iron complex transport system substrate-binding protein
MRIVSLIASSTEMVCALGAGAQLVGRSHECDFPDWVRSLPVVTEPKLDVDGTSYEIDARVKAILQEGLSVYRVHADVLDELAPDVIVTQAHCVVCAVSVADVEEAVHKLVRSRPRIVALEPNRLADVWTDLGRVATAIGRVDEGRALRAALRARMEEVAAHASAAKARPRVACVEWIEPLMAAGNWMPELVALAGGENLFGTVGAHSPWLSWADLVLARPDVVVITPCGFDLARTRAELGAHDWASLGARVVLADGNAYFNRPGPRLVESLEILAEIFHPGHCVYGHAGRAWEDL